MRNSASRVSEVAEICSCSQSHHLVGATPYAGGASANRDCFVGRNSPAAEGTAVGALRDCGNTVGDGRGKVPLEVVGVPPPWEEVVS